jgi:ribose-phosphate pyrophosphokinase
MIDTAGTIVAACRVLKQNGAKRITITATHGILSDPACERLDKAVQDGTISNIYLTNTIESVYQRDIDKLHIVDIGKYLAEIIQVYHTYGGSISKVYEIYESPRQRTHK